MIQRLIVLRDASGVGPKALLRGRRTEMPDGLNAATISAWLNGTAGTARPEHLAYVLTVWEACVPEQELVVVDDARRHALQDEIDRTGIGPYALITRFPAAFCDRLSGPQLGGWFIGGPKRAAKELYDLALQCWQSLPDDDRVTITAEVHAALQKAKRESGVKAHALLLYCKDDAPSDLTSDMIDRWIARGTRTARKPHLNFVLRHWPDLKAPSQPVQRRPDNGRVVISEAVLSELRHHRQRTGLGAVRFLRCLDDVIPDGLKSETISSWLSGAVGSAKPQYLDFVRKAWADLPDANAGPSRTPEGEQYIDIEMVEITYALREALMTARVRSDVTPAALLREAGDDVPDGLTSTAINGWLKGKVFSAPKAHVEFVQRTWSAIEVASSNTE